jgi:membrane protease YdiL (CAAX protease family)
MLVRRIAFLATFLAAWFALDRMAASPPMPVPAALALGVALLILATGEILAFGANPRTVLLTLGYGRPDDRAIVLALIVGAAVILGYLAGAAALGIQLDLRPNWPLVLVGALLFHGLAEESVWRGFVYRHLREGRTFGRAVLVTIPFIALTHVPIIASNGWLVGALALLTAAVTCVPLAYLWDHGPATVWAPAIVHGMVGAWQLFDRTYPVTFSVVVMVVTLTVPLLVFPIGRRLFGRTPAEASQAVAIASPAS